MERSIELRRFGPDRARIRPYPVQSRSGVFQLFLCIYALDRQPAGVLWNTSRRGVFPSLGLTYNSVSTDSTFFGSGWSDRYSRSLQELTNAATIHSGDGGILKYTNKDASGFYDPPLGASNVLQKIGSTWTETRPDGFKMNYDSSGNMVQTEDVAGNLTTLSYTGSPARLQTITDPAGGVTTYTYSSGTPKLQSISDSSGRVTQFEINGSDDLVSYTSPELCVTSLVYDGDRRITSIIDPEGNRHTYAYDGSRRVTKYEDPQGNRTTFTYALFGPGVAIQNPRVTRQPSATISPLAG